MLAAQMAHPWMVLRIISAVMDKPSERYLRDSELGGFAERVTDNVLHDRAGFTDDPAQPRLLFRARYLDRVSAD